MLEVVVFIMTLIFLVFSFFMNPVKVDNWHPAIVPPKTRTFADLYNESTCWRRDPRISKLDDNLFISNAECSGDYKRLRDLGITQILTIGKELRPHTGSGFKTMYISLDDTPGEKISDHFTAAHEFIDQGRTLVHCYAGVSRSATLCISYLMKKYKTNADVIIKYCRTQRPIINPNPGFVQQLKDFEKLVI